MFMFVGKVLFISFYAAQDIRMRQIGGNEKIFPFAKNKRRKRNYLKSSVRSKVSPFILAKILLPNYVPATPFPLA